MFFMARILVPILLSTFALGDLSKCEVKLNEWLRAWVSTAPTKYEKMISYSGRGINDLGLYDPCEDTDDARYALFQIRRHTPVLVFGLCLPDDCSESDLFHVLKYGLNLTAGQSLSKHSFSERLNLISSSVLEGDHEINQEARRRLSKASSLIERISFPKHHIHGLNNFSGSAMFCFLICIILLALAALGTCAEIKGLELRAEAMKAITGIGSGSDDSDASSGELTVNSDKSLGKIKGLSKVDNLPRWAQFILCFSLYSNAVRLFATKEEKKKDPLDSINMMKVMSMGVIILGHTYMIHAYNTPIFNYFDIIPSMSHFNFTIVQSGLLAVDTFFWISGFLQGYLMTQQFNSGKKINFPMLILHRFIRILPVYMFATFFGWALTKYMGNGPMWYDAERKMHGDCEQVAWSYPLFLNNFVIPEGTNNCLVGAWYLPNDMQFYLLSLPIMYLYVRQSRLFGWALLNMCVIFSIIANGTITYNEHLRVKIDDSHNKHYFFDDLYYKPWCRIAPYAIGIMAGYVFHAFKKGKEGEEFDPVAGAIAHYINTNVVVRWVCYGVGLFFINLFIFLPYDAYQGDDTWSNSKNAAYNSFNRVGWGLGLSLVFLPICMGHLTAVRQFMMSNWFSAPSKLVFAIYLNHMTIGQTFMYSRPFTFNWTQWSLFQDALFIYGLSLLLCIPINLVVESPAVNLEKFYFHNNR